MWRGDAVTPCHSVQQREYNILIMLNKHTQLIIIKWFRWCKVYQLRVKLGWNLPTWIVFYSTDHYKRVHTHTVHDHEIFPVFVVNLWSENKTFICRTFSQCMFITVGLGGVSGSGPITLNWCPIQVYSPPHCRSTAHLTRIKNTISDITVDRAALDSAVHVHLWNIMWWPWRRPCPTRWLVMNLSTPSGPL